MRRFARELAPDSSSVQWYELMGDDRTLLVEIWFAEDCGDRDPFEDAIVAYIASIPDATVTLNRGTETVSAVEYASR